MKKIFIFAAIAALALTSCVKNDGAYVADNNEIAFRNFTLSSKALDATALDATAAAMPTTASFSVWAFLNADNTTAYVVDQPVTYKGTSPDQYWGFTNAIYWPSNGAALDFYAYYPAAATASINNTSKVITLTDADLTATTDSQVDFMVSTGATNQTGNADVALVFKHLASVILFKVKDNTTDVNFQGNVTVKKIELLNVSTKGTYVQTAAGAAADGWTANATRTASLAAYNDATGQNVTTAAAAITAMDAGAVIVVPETFADNTQKIKVTYDVAAYGSVKALTGQVKEIELYGMVASHTAWELGKKYTYTIGFKLDANEITFDPSVTDWETSTDVTVPTIQ